MGPNRAAGRNVWIAFATDPENIRRGMRAGPALTKSDFLLMMGIVFRAPGGVLVRPKDSGIPVDATDELLAHGHSLLSPNAAGEEVKTSNERYYTRTLSISVSGRDDAFCDQFRKRHKRCVISGHKNHAAYLGEWDGWQAAHIVPLALEKIFSDHRYVNFVTDKREVEPGINSPQNSLLLRSNVKALWDNYWLAVNPKNNYKVYSFGPQAYHITCDIEVFTSEKGCVGT